MRTTDRDSYHHGNLRAALVECAMELIAERGVRRFSVAEVSRRLGVSVAAPFRHFRDRDELLAAVAVRACDILAAAVANVTEPADMPAELLARRARAYVRCAASNAALFETLFGGDKDRTVDPDIDRAADPVARAFLSPARELCGNHRGAHRLTVAIVAAAHGHATLFLQGAFGQGAGALTRASECAAGATRAIVTGRSSLTGQ